MRARVRIWFIGLAFAATGTFLTPGLAMAEDMVSTSFLLRGGNINAGGSADMLASPPGSGIGSLGASIGQSEALGYSGSLATLSTNAPGFWPLVAGDLPMLDADEDGIQAFLDNCPWAANPGQGDSGGVGTGSAPDGIGDVCQCGDVDDNGTVEDVDVLDYRDDLAAPSLFPLPPAGVAKCTVIDPPSDCDVLDMTVVRRALEGPSGLPPGIASVCEAARPPSP
jgi:hypothetical protein